MCVNGDMLGDNHTCAGVRKLVLPETIEIIHDFAFWYCSKLEELDLAHTKITSIGGNCFYNGRNILRVTLPDTLEEMKEKIFWSCAGITEIDLSRTKVTIINEATFKVRLVASKGGHCS